jgi:hypothetical protein
MVNESIEIIEFIDLLNFTFSDSFVEKWRFKYSVAFVKKFQYKVLLSIQSKKPIKLKSLKQYLIKKYKYSSEQVEDFLDDIEISLYYPLVM